MKKIAAVILLMLVSISLFGCNGEGAATPEQDDGKTEETEYPITDLWVNRYNTQTRDYDFSPCGYIDEYTSTVEVTDDIVKTISGTRMYLGTIKGYQNADKTIQIYQVKLPELSPNFVLTNDSFKFDYSGNSKMIEVEGWIYLDKTTIIGVSPLYNE